MSDELAALDATAQAELVATGEATAGRAGRRGDRAHRGAQPARSTRSSTRSSRRRCEAAARRAARRPLQGRAVPAQGPRRRLRRRAVAHGDAAASRSATSARPVDTYLGAALPRRRASSRSARRTRPSSGILPTTEPDAYGATRNPWDTRPLAGRLERRLGGGGRRRAWCRSRTPTTAAARSGSRPADCGLVGLKPTRAADLARARWSATSCPA